MVSSNRQTEMPSLVIIGNGITGITAARTARKLLPQLRITIISEETDFFYSRPALMYIYMGHMRLEDTQPYEPAFFKQNRLDLVRGRVASVQPDEQQLALEDGQKIRYDYLLLALGSVSNRFGWPGQDLGGVQGLYSYQDLEQLERHTNPKPERAVIVGGGLIGIELAEMLATRQIPVTFLVRESSYMNHVFPAEESALINQEIARHHIDLRLSEELREIIDDGSGKVGAVVTGSGERIACGLVGLTAGVSPNLSLAKAIVGLETARGILVDAFLQTNLLGIFAAGDCAQLRVDGKAGPVEQLWYTGRMQGETAARRIAELAAGKMQANTLPVLAAEPYDRGIWFNSAKFFNLEWQTYGFVPKAPDAERTFWWQDEAGRRGVRLVWDAKGSDTRITGFNFMGLRYRHGVCETWIREERSVPYVIEHLKDANFDPEFFGGPERAIARAFRKNNLLAVGSR